ncbi:unnamed protein product [Protopolystoma xenopodis]|uniref:Dynein heavy chain AAA 5 extension domain-containing protein n=1 Tax=Protopolystoma xenopodis TaxID=117903 RepID=A0A448X5F2_9PLAT|nr:unnamed protein product [Protopolystoma xenopodis]
MIYLEPSSLGWRPLACSWLKRLPPLLSAGDGQEALESLLEWLVDPTLRFVYTSCRQMVPTSPTNLVCSLLGFIDALVGEAAVASDAEDNRHLRNWCFSSLLFGLVWAIGGCLDFDSRTLFSTFIRELLAGQNTNHPVPKIFGGRIDFCMPEQGMVYDYWFEVNSPSAVFYHLH